MSKLQRFLKHKIPFSKYWNQYHNPLYYWWKVRKYFKRPKAHFIRGTNLYFFGFPCSKEYLNRFIDIRFEALGWKTKYSSYRHEYDPYISITLFRKYMYIWMFNWVNSKDGVDSGTRSKATWEAILDMIYSNKSIEWVKKNHVWGRINDKNAVITINSNLNKEFQ